MALQRPLRGSRISTFYPVKNLPSLSSLDSAFQLQEHMSHLIRLDVHDVDAISVNVDEACWKYEQLRRLAQDLSHDSHPLITMLQQVCTRTTCPEMKAGEWLYLYVLTAMTEPWSPPQLSARIPFQTTNPSRLPPALHLPRAPIFADAYFHHREEFEQAEAESSLHAGSLALTEKLDFRVVPADFRVIPRAPSLPPLVLLPYYGQCNLQRPSLQRPEPAFFAALTFEAHREAMAAFQQTVHPNLVELERIVTTILNSTHLVPKQAKGDRCRQKLADTLKRRQFQEISHGPTGKEDDFYQPAGRPTTDDALREPLAHETTWLKDGGVRGWAISYDGALFAQAHNLLTKKPQLEASSAPRSRRTRTRGPLRAFVADDRALIALRPSTQQDSQPAVDSSRRTAALRSRRARTERTFDATSSPSSSLSILDVRLLMAQRTPFSATPNSSAFS
ncbi:hypothetical protein B0H12DRAFT_1324536 [Mycena haematopus]|nr:hypothetical protein B0H12DRAFT_1324536 [Mycena haematopus]